MRKKEFFLTAATVIYFFENARKMGINLRFLDYLVLSHCHLDHTWGMETLIREYTEARLEKQNFQKPLLIAHPKIFVSTYINGVGEIGTLLSENKFSHTLHYNLAKIPLLLRKTSYFLERYRVYFHLKPCLQ